jgi:hypothetical protein
MTAAVQYWGPHFPDASGTALWFGPHFPDGIAQAGVIVGSGPAGVFSFALSLESGAQLTWTWLTDVFKAYDGSERRIAAIDQPKSSVSGQAYLIGDATRATRAQIARSAASGAPFTLGLPYEGVTMTGPASGKVLPVDSTLALDWCQLGQRVIVQLGDAFISAVIQAFTSNTITIDEDPSSVDGFGAVVMPAVAIFLLPQQGFARYRDPNSAVEAWNIQADIVPFGFQSDGLSAFLLFAGLSTALATAGVQWPVPGAFALNISIAFVGDNALGLTFVTASGTNYTLHFTPGTSTAANAVAALAAAGFNVIGTYTATAVLHATVDEFTARFLGGGVDPSIGTWGRGATLTFHAGVPIWDRGVEVDGETVGDSVQAMNEILDLDGQLMNIGPARVPDWGRAIAYEHDLGAEWQWLKLFLYTVRGCQQTWWYPTARADLVPVSGGVGTITIEGPSLESGDFFAFYPSQRNALMVQQINGALTYTSIASAVDNGNGSITITVTIDAASATMNASGLPSEWSGMTFTWTAPGTAGNGKTLTAVALSGGLGRGPCFCTSPDGINFTLGYWPGFSTLGAAQSALDRAGFTIGGVFSSSTVLQSGSAFAARTFAGGTSSSPDFSGAAIESLSWLELCRLESDDVQITFGVGTFAISATGRVVQG